MNELEKLAREFEEKFGPHYHLALCECHYCSSKNELKSFIFGTFAVRLLEPFKHAIKNRNLDLIAEEMIKQCQRIAEEGK